MDNEHNPIVFISYSQDSASLADKVLELSNKLRSEGIDTILDQYEVQLSRNVQSENTQNLK